MQVMENAVKGKFIIVTGSRSGLGAALAEQLHFCGAHVIEYDLKNGDDVCSPSPWLAKLPRVDGLINCAGINSNDWFCDVKTDDLFKVMEVNAFSMAYMTKAVLPKLTESKGFVINIVSNASHIPMTSSLAYNMSKAAALMATKQMAHELTKTRGVTVFSVSPNKLEGTEMSAQIEAEVQRVRGWTKEYAAQYQKCALMHGLETPPEAVASVIVDVLSSGAWKYMSGTDIPVGK